MFTTRHYTEIARVIRNRREWLDQIPSSETKLTRNSEIDIIEHLLCRMFAEDNKLFNEKTFKNEASNGVGN